MNIILWDTGTKHLFPLTLTRPVCDLRIGILTIREKWEKQLTGKSSTYTRSTLSEKFPLIEADDNLIINGAILPDATLIDAVGQLQLNQMIQVGETLVALRLDREKLNDFTTEGAEFTCDSFQLDHPLSEVKHTWDLFQKNGEALIADLPLVFEGKENAPISPSNTIIGDQVFVEEGAKIEGATLNSTTGPIYIGKAAEVMEGALIRGPFALCEGATVKLGTKIYGPTTIGPHSKVGGEISNSVVLGYSNKGHDGFMGNSVLGEWCNLGADTNTSNLKNNYGNVKCWDYAEEKLQNTGLTFVGLTMGDHSKCGINTMFNTGTVVGVGANIFGGDFPPKFIPSFTWGGAKGFTTYKLDKAFEVATAVCKRRDIDFSEADARVLEQVFAYSDRFRSAVIDQDWQNNCFTGLAHPLP